jgi:hypothetical protein
MNRRIKADWLGDGNPLSILVACMHAQLPIAILINQELIKILGLE